MMKVLSIKEPCASLIKEKKKLIETRSWKTSYRGELYIHASKSKVVYDERNLLSLLSTTNFHFGFILCKCKLVDCIYMTEEYVEDMKQNHPQEYLCGEYKMGRYAWVLDEIEPLEKPIKAKGALGIWNYYTEKEIFSLLKEIQYGWIGKKHEKHFHIKPDFDKEYFLQTPREMMKTKIGVCWDQVELERFYLTPNEWNTKTFYIIAYGKEKCYTHTFLTFEKNGNFYWFEHAWEKFAGIFKYETLDSLLKDIKEKFLQFEVSEEIKVLDFKIFEYEKPPFHISANEFMKYCEKGKEIILDN